ncbi:GntR family transcriptional regulator [Nocardia brasiliensis ATCC 700358]|uniref:GntR family transcriptional regulator n=1 Tax=Nocardia brasiliensis (strain ATCC 700358 / HUJEG-1) TaxID=1133849 RepID=K0EQM5_NOCB7|nr:GntR family transcriptional regulator [Nocardia brasiliensis ATCC 700358]
MALQPVVKRSVSGDVFEQIVADVLSGELAPGATLPSERQLAEALGVSRPAVREALQRLAAAGLVSVRQGDATTVLDYRRGAGLEVLPRLLVQAGELDPAVARSILEARLHNGPKVAELAAARSPRAHTEPDAAPYADGTATTTPSADRSGRTTPTSTSSATDKGDTSHTESAETTPPSGTTASSTTTPGATTPGATTSDRSASGTTTFGTTPSDTTTPDKTASGTAVSGATTSGTNDFGATTSGATTSGATTSGATTSGTTTSGATTSGTTTSGTTTSGAAASSARPSGGTATTADTGPAIFDALLASVEALAAEGDPVVRQRLALDFWDHVVDAADSIVFRLMFNMLRAAYEPALVALAPIMSAEVGNVGAYRELAAAIVAGRPQEAAETARALLEPATTALIEVLGGH